MFESYSGMEFGLVKYYIYDKENAEIYVFVDVFKIIDVFNVFD